MDRRTFLKLSGANALGLLAGGTGSLVKPLLAAGQPDKPGSMSPDLEIRLTAQKDRVPIFSGEPTGVWRYSGTILKGDPARLQTIEKSYLGPIIRVRTGERVRVHFENRIPQPSIIHWHGLHVPEAADGHPRLAVSEGETYTYEFQVKDRAGTYWYHPHPHGRTGLQVYGGMAGLFLVTDDEEQSLGLPSDDYDIPLVIQDRVFDDNNQLVYMARGHMERMTGALGDRILINGRPKATLKVASRVYRLRLLNGSNSRIYRIAWSDGTPLAVMGTDGGLLGKPALRDQVFLAPAERIELWADFSAYRVGDEPTLASLPFDGGPGMGRSSIPVNGAPMNLVRFRVDRKEHETRRLPESLARIDPPDPQRAVNRERPRQFSMVMGHMRGTINGRVFQMTAVADDEVVRLGTEEIWEFTNEPGRGMMGMASQPHPIHVHGLQFRVLGRRGVRHRGYVDDGWKDTVLLFPGETVRLQMRFEDYPGLFLYHCHNLEHEDGGMMRNYYIQSA